VLLLPIYLVLQVPAKQLVRKITSCTNQLGGSSPMWPMMCWVGLEVLLYYIYLPCNVNFTFSDVLMSFEVLMIYCNDVARVQLCCLCVFGHREWQAVLCFVEIVWLMLIDVLWSTTTMMSRVYHGLERLWYNLLISWPSCCGQHGPTNSAINWSRLVTLQWSGLWDVISLQALEHFASDCYRL